MRKLVLLLSALLLACGTTEPKYKKANTAKENSNLMAKVNIKSMSDEIANLVNTSSDSLSMTYLKNKKQGSLEDVNTQDYNAQKSLNKILNAGDTREVVYLVHPTKEMLVYCHHDIESECYIEGLHDGRYFEYDISQVEAQNMGKLTFHTQNIESAKTTPIEWIAVENDYVMIPMTSKIMLSSRQHTLHEPVVIDYLEGMKVR